ncbi:MAG TPA: glycosyltransferase family 9 protein [Longimicrobium sp.]|nr:glycosyltransferase family 9 protein [Longimicrobium sp.]
MPPTDLNGARVAIVMMSAIGDAVHVLPVVNALRRAAPSVHLTWLLQPGPASLVRDHPGVNEIVTVDPRRGLRGLVDAGMALRRGGFDLLIDLQVAFKAGIVTALAKAPVKLGFDRARARDLNWLFTNRRIPPHAPQHVQDQYFEFLAHLGVDPEPVEWRIGPWEHESAWQQEFVARVGRPYVAINLATSNPEKDWLPERWAAVVDALHERHGLASVLVGGPSEREREMERQLRAAARHQPVSALGSGLRNLVGILDAAELVLALDSAPLHIAVALGRPVVSLCAVSDPRRTGPFRRFHDLVVDAYHDPGEQGPVSMQRRRGRMPRITVDHVLEKVELWDARYRRR